MVARPGLELRVAEPAVALETAFLVAGLPDDRGIEAAERMGAAVEAAGARPAFVGVLGGTPVLGLTREELERLAGEGRKASTRDLPAVLARGGSAGTTVAATLLLSRRAGLRVVATGGIGGVHPLRGSGDVSADLVELSRSPIVVVCSGPKAFLDLPATLERLETLGVTVAGYRTERMPAFWTVDGGRDLEWVISSPEEAAAIAASADRLNLPGALVVCVPPPSDSALPRDESVRATHQALADLGPAGVTGTDVTPFLLARIAELTDGRSVRANLDLLERNARVAGEVAVALHRT